MKDSVTRAILIVLSLVGLADAIYLTDMAFTGGTLVCDFEGLNGCNTVAQSAYSWVFGLPLALYGVMFYLAFLAVLFLHQHLSARLYRKTLIILALIGVGFSTYFIYLQQFVIKALCVYCLGSALISYLLAVLVFARKKPAETPGSEPLA